MRTIFHFFLAALMLLMVPVNMQAQNSKYHVRTDGEDQTYTTAEIFIKPVMATLGNPTGEGDFRLKESSVAIDKGDAIHRNTGIGASEWTTIAPFISLSQPALIIIQPKGATFYVKDTYTMMVVAIGTNLIYQWYKDGVAIPDATADSYTINDAQLTDGGSYYVVVMADVGASLTSDDGIITVLNHPNKPNPINHMVLLPQIQGINTNTVPGIHYIHNRTHFVFEIWPQDGYSIRDLMVRTDQSNEVVIETINNEQSRSSDNTSFVGDERLRVTVRYIRASTTILIEGVSTTVNQQVPQSSRIWSYGGNVYYSLEKPTEVSIYTITGMLYDQRTMPAGNTTMSLPTGLYIIHMPGTEAIKVTVK